MHARCDYARKCVHHSFCCCRPWSTRTASFRRFIYMQYCAGDVVLYAYWEVMWICRATVWLCCVTVGLCGQSTSETKLSFTSFELDKQLDGEIKLFRKFREYADVASCDFKSDGIRSSGEANLSILFGKFETKNGSVGRQYTDCFSLRIETDNINFAVPDRFISLIWPSRADKIVVKSTKHVHPGGRMSVTVRSTTRKSIPQQQMQSI